MFQLKLGEHMGTTQVTQELLRDYLGCLGTAQGQLRLLGRLR